MLNEPVVHIVDDDAAIRDSLAFLLDTANLRSRTYDSAAALLASAGNLAPGCIVTDVRMPDMNGLEMVRRLTEIGVGHPVIVMTGHADVPLAIEAVRAGVKDFIEKPFDDDALLASVRAAIADQTLAAEHAGRNAELRERLASLSARERQVLDGRGLPGQCHDQDAGPQPVRTRPHDDPPPAPLTRRPSGVSRR